MQPSERDNRTLTLPVVGVEILFLADTGAGAWGDIPHKLRGGFGRDV